MTYDGGMIATLLLLAACTEETDKRTDTDTGGYVPTDTGGDSAPPVVEATPYLGLAAATTPGSLASTCQMHVDVFTSADGEVVASADLAAQGMAARNVLPALCCAGVLAGAEDLKGHTEALWAPACRGGGRSSSSSS